ncbi:hypothetical protein HY357_00700 [Candidatus Roizmanbacteria bacterium]|nr:hypothetical protein [Candidatus Roizmanbacteria bacterium]
MKIVYTYHAKRKFREEKYIKQLKITRKTVKKVILKPTLEDKSRGEKITAVGIIDERHSLVVIYKKVENGLKIITFFPAEKGRYENKILQRRRHFSTKTIQ